MIDSAWASNPDYRLGLGRLPEFDDDWISMEDRLGLGLGSGQNPMTTGFRWMVDWDMIQFFYPPL